MLNIKSHSRQFLKKGIRKIPFLKKYIQRYDLVIKAYAERFNEIGFPPGHYYSSIPSLDEIKINEHRIFENENIKDINFNLSEQYDLLQELKAYYSTVPYNFIQPELIGQKVYTSHNDYYLKYFPENAWYRYSDVIFLMSLIRHFKPKKIIEVGSGHSSAVMLDTNNIFFENNISLTFIEPYPEERLSAVLKKADTGNITVIKNKIQDVDANLFKSLEENDILFIDTSHVSKTGSDVNHIFFEILPLLKPGVLIHFHDIFYPFELPKRWLYDKKWFWNENYILRAFLMNNQDYKIFLFNSMLHKKYTNWFKKEMPDCLLGSEETGSIWLKKIISN